MIRLTTSSKQTKYNLKFNWPHPGNNELNWLSGSYMESISAFNTRGQILFSEEVNFDKGRCRGWPTGLYLFRQKREASIADFPLNG